MKKNDSDVEMRKKSKQEKLFYEKPRCVEVQLMADQTLGGCNLSSNIDCDPVLMVS